MLNSPEVRSSHCKDLRLLCSCIAVYFNNLRRMNDLTVFNRLVTCISGPHHLFISGTEVQYFKYQIQQSVSLPLIPVDDLGQCFVLLLGYNRLKILYSCSCNALQLFKGLEDEEGQINAVCRDPAGKQEWKQTVYFVNSKSQNPHLVTAIVRSAVLMMGM